MFLTVSNASSRIFTGYFLAKKKSFIFLDSSKKSSSFVQLRLMRLNWLFGMFKSHLGRWQLVKSIKLFLAVGLIKVLHWYLLWFLET